MKSGRLTTSLVLIAAAACGDSDARDGDSSLTLTADEPAGSNCAYGGVAISTGLDANGNGKLDDSEDPTVRYVCNGIGGENGQDGDGGLSALQPVVTTTAAAGADCPNGGVTITVGFDRNGDGDITDTGETNGQPRNLCNGTGGQLTAAASEPAGANCASGGVAINNGTDANQNGRLDTAEISATTYACTKPSDVNGQSPIQVDYAGDQGDEPPEPDFYVSSATPPTAGGTPVILNTASISVPGPGSILVFASTNASCEPNSASTADGSEEYNCAPVGDISVAHLTIVQQGVADPGGTSGSFQQLYLSPGVEATMTTSEVFRVTAAGVYTFLAVGQAGYNVLQPTPPGADTNISFLPAEVTLVFIPG